ncbi:MAG: DUF1573 domain-containing protein [Syntrophaceae bacterium]
MRRSLWLAVVAVLTMTGSAFSAAAAPKVMIAEPQYMFGQVLDGVVVTHDFVIRNQGDAPLIIGRVRTDCGCTTTSFTRQIPAGGEGKLTVKVSTAGYGGSLIRHEVRVETNDPLYPRLKLLISGEVREFARIDPGAVILKGKAGMEVKAFVTVTPIHPFTALKAYAREGVHIRVIMQEALVEGRKVYTVIIENTMNVPGTYTDSIIVDTDSPVRPEIAIGVQGEIS